MVKPLNVKEFDNFSGDLLAICQFFCPNPVQNCDCEFCFSIQDAKFRNFVHFPTQTILFSP